MHINISLIRDMFIAAKEPIIMLFCKLQVKNDNYKLDFVKSEIAKVKTL